MQVEMKNYTVHLGEHNFGIEKAKKTRGHKLNSPREGVEGLGLPFLVFSAKDHKAAEQFVTRLNIIADRYDIDGLDLASLVAAADKLTGE